LFAIVEQLIRVSPTRFRIPDICVTLQEPDQQVFTAPPFLCVEVLSPEDRADRIQRKIADCLKAFTYTASGMRAAEDGMLRTADPDIAVPLADVC
jgi:hypothetical protein